MTDPWLENERHRQYVGLAFVALLMMVGHMLRGALDFDGVLDTDVMNFGLAAYKFDLSQHQPHPPGYPGYILYLKLIHLVLPGLAPEDVAKLGTRLCGAAMAPAAYWATRQWLHNTPMPVGRPLAAAGWTVVSPILWFYGGDGQAHGAEALLVLLLFGLVAVAKRRGTLGWALFAVVAFGLSGSVRPTIPLLTSPLLVWLFWGRRPRDWVSAALVGVASVIAWYIPLIIASGGLDLYRRLTRALVGELFIGNFSVFGARSTAHTITRNLVVTGFAAVIAALPLVSARPAQHISWSRIAFATLATNVLFYALLFTSETGYLSGVAAMAALVPITWPAQLPRSTKLTYAAATFASLGFVWFGPAALPIPAGPPAPTYSHAIAIATAQEFHTALMCGAAQGRPALVLTDNPVTTHNRWLAMACPELTVALYVRDFPLREGLDNWVIFKARSLHAIPPPVPLEPGPPATYTLPPVELVLVTPGTSEKWREEIAASTHCAPTVIDSPDLQLDRPVLTWSSECWTAFEFGQNRLILSN